MNGPLVERILDWLFPMRPVIRDLDLAAEAMRQTVAEMQDFCLRHVDWGYWTEEECRGEVKP